MRTLREQIGGLTGQTRTVVMTCTYGLAAGGIAVAFQLCVKAFYNLTLGQLFGASPVVFLLGSAVVMVGTSLAAGWLLSRFEPGAAGSGIPQLKLAFWRDFGLVPVRVLWVKFLAGVLAVGGGSSLGREGPSVQLGGGLASNLAGFLGEPKHRRRLAAAAGAAAGLAAAFNTPLAAVTFVLEEIIGDLNSRLLGSVLLASVLGAFVVHAALGDQPAFAVGEMNDPAWRIYAVAPVAAAVAAFLGVGFQKYTLELRQRMRGWNGCPAWAKPAVGGTLTWALGAGVFLGTGHTGVFSLGYTDLGIALDGQILWKTAAVLLVAKFIATVASYGTGGCGGIFAPTLFLGTMAGVVVSGLAQIFFHLSAADQTALALVGMSAFLGAVVRAPVTGILIVFEMTHDFALVPALMLAALISQAVSRWLLPSGFYDALLEQDGIHLEHTLPPRDLRSWLARPVAAIANLHPIVVTELTQESLRLLLEHHTYERFPVIRAGQPPALLTRLEIEQSLRENREPRPESVPICAPTLPLNDVQALLIESTRQIVLLVEDGKLAGLVTLHDLLRAQTNLAGE